MIRRLIPHASALLGLLALMALSTPFGAVWAVQSEEEVDLNSLAGTYLAARTADVEKDIPNAARFYRSALESDPDNTFLIERAMVLTAAAGDVTGSLAFAGRLREL
jgi:hypothetical protein